MLETEAREPFRMRRLQVHNWGTFSGLTDIPISEEGFLFVGRSGSGKSTLLDAGTALLIPPQWAIFNAAARDGDKQRRDRDLISYIRGAWADQKDIDSGEIATQYLRPRTTWSALGVQYGTTTGQVVTLAQVFWIRGTSTRIGDVRRLFLVADRALDLFELKDFGDLDVRRLKQKLGDVHFSDTFSRYAERFCPRLGIESDQALKLLHKTQSAKNLGDLNAFVRDFMLDLPLTFQAAAQLVEEFKELDDAHRTVVTARRQIDMLRPAREDYAKLLAARAEAQALDDAQSSIDVFRDECKAELLLQEIERLQVCDEALKAQEEERRESVGSLKLQLKHLEASRAELGGSRIEDLRKDLEAAESQRNERLEKRVRAEQAFQLLQHRFPASADEFAERISEARKALDGRAGRMQKCEERRETLRARKKEVEREFSAITRELEAMRRQSSNIPADMLDLRMEIASGIGVPEDDLPFAGELLDVKKGEESWRGVIERVLRGFALSLLVPDARYAAVSGYVNEQNLQRRLVYYRVPEERLAPFAIPAASMARKLKVKDGKFASWLEHELARRYDYTCSDNLREFRRLERALTKEGQIKHDKSRHEKNDSRPLDDPRSWVLGFDNLEKTRLFQKQANELASEIRSLDQKLTTIADDVEALQQRVLASQTLVNTRWNEVDVAGTLKLIRGLNETLRELERGNPKLKELEDLIKAQEDRVESARGALSDTQSERRRIARQIGSHKEQQQVLRKKAGRTILNDGHRAFLKARFDKPADPLSLDNLDERTTKVERAMNDEWKSLREQESKLSHSLTRCFGRFLAEWGEFRANLDDKIESTPQFIGVLDRLEKDDLPRHEQRFFDLLREQSTQNLAALHRHLTEARKEIHDRMGLVNQSLSHVEFNAKTHLEIKPADRYLPEVQLFREQVKQVLDHAWSADHDRETAEAKFGVLRDLVTKLASKASEDLQWQNTVLDVRYQLEFIGREYDREKNEVEVYRSGAGKSGGQREKLATTCLAAALRYQLGGAEGGRPVFAPVVLDEAFGKADNEFTEQAMKIFAEFGFQMIVATPLKSVMTLEPFIGGACFVDIADRKRSAVLQIRYDREQRRLQLTDRMHGEAVAD